MPHKEFISVVGMRSWQTPVLAWLNDTMTLVTLLPAYLHSTPSYLVLL
jgi:hypothetical protein